jgi:hypothetical protein
MGQGRKGRNPTPGQGGCLPGMTLQERKFAEDFLSGTVGSESIWSRAICGAR